MKKLFLGLSVLSGSLFVWGVGPYLTSGNNDATGIGYLIAKSVTVLFAMSLFLWFRESRVSLNQATSLDRIIRIIVMIFLLIFIFLGIFFPWGVIMILEYLLPI